MTTTFTDEEYWAAIVLYGLNSATYKMALGKTLLDLGQQGEAFVPWEVLAKTYFDNYVARLLGPVTLPQQGNPTRLTVMERIVRRYLHGSLEYSQAVAEVARTAFSDVIPRFQTIGNNKELARGKFYQYREGHSLTLTDTLLAVAQSAQQTSLRTQLESRWNLLEGAFKMVHDHSSLQNDLRDIYLINGYQRTSLTTNIPFLEGYQGNACFYCGEAIPTGDVHVDHVLPRQVLNHDEIWNLVLAHSYCNTSKSDKLVGEHYIHKLIQRNENIMGSNHPWKARIERELGTTGTQRAKTLRRHYDNVKMVMGPNYWGGTAAYNPATDPFFRKFITVLNNG
ncbi:HNH endonuclease [Hymenobacter sp. BT491]|uniref:HNH endonuclease n=1 Tax=Hymenobacter sp. BT491 TaxID=2766779 RepID=UPI0016534F44|nr:HNH endonuclease domain-containing protein [Hymenobacter sp. BT491]MBC6992289.1 HNH endonuclease [Hymenobacter sp. BT491]